jgi:hypothetical protein
MKKRPPTASSISYTSHKIHGKIKKIAGDLFLDLAVAGNGCKPHAYMSGRRPAGNEQRWL